MLDLALKLQLEGKIQVSLQSVAEDNDSILFGSGFSLAYSRDTGNSWNISAGINAAYVNRQNDQLVISIVRPINLLINVIQHLILSINSELNI